MDEHLAIEFHDSSLVQATVTGSELSLLLDAYVHHSTGRPGLDSGTVWNQQARVLLRGFGGESPPSITIADGTLVALDRRYENVVPVPFEANGPCRIELQGSRGETLSLDGESVTIALAGEATYVEVFPGSEG